MKQAYFDSSIRQNQHQPSIEWFLPICRVPHSVWKKIDSQIINVITVYWAAYAKRYKNTLIYSLRHNIGILFLFAWFDRKKNSSWLYNWFFGCAFRIHTLTAGYSGTKIVYIDENIPLHNFSQ